MSEDETVEEATDGVVEDETIEFTLEEKLAEAIDRAERPKPKSPTKMQTSSTSVSEMP